MGAVSPPFASQEDGRGILPAGISDPSAGSEHPRTGRVSIIIPVYNAMEYLRETVPSVLAAARRLPDSELLFVDNGSTDGSYEYLCSLGLDGAIVLRREHATIAAVRNHGAQHATGEYLSFLDSDCLIPESYFPEAVAVLERTAAVATGCETDIPSPPHWIERVWHQLHYGGRDRFVHYLNSANFFITRAAFEKLGGFREDLRTGEDSEIGKRILQAGHRIFECTRVAAVHLGNPKSIRQFYRRNVWHALGMFGTIGRQGIDKPTAMLAAHVLATAAGLMILLSGRLSLPAGLALALGLQLLVPTLTVLFRYWQTGRFGRYLPAIVLYWLYYWARLQALALILARRDRRYGK